MTGCVWPCALMPTTMHGHRKSVTNARSPGRCFVDRETQLDETTTGGIALSTADKPAIVSGQVKDAQARFNLNNLIDYSKEPVIAIAPKQVEAFKRLLNQLQLAEGLADTLAEHLLLTRPRKVGEALVQATRPRMIFVEELQALPGFSAEALRKLERFVIFFAEVHDGQCELCRARGAGRRSVRQWAWPMRAACRKPHNAVSRSTPWARSPRPSAATAVMT